MKKNKQVFVFFFILFSIGIIAQNKQTFKFIEINKKPSWDGGYTQRDYEYTRIIYKDSIFEEVGLFLNDRNVSFKIKKGCWYIKKGKKWELFYSPKFKISPKIKLGNLIYTLTYKDVTKVGKLDCIIYWFEYFEADNTTEKNGIKTVHVVSDFGGSSYFFNPKYGFVKIVYDNGNEFIREDVLNFLL